MFGALHYGIPVIPGDARSRGMGGVSMAINGEDFSFSNPARTVNFWRSGFNGVVSQEYRTLKTPQGEANLRSTAFTAFHGVFPSYKKFVFSWGIYQWRDLSWEYSDKVSLDFLTNPLGRQFSSSGNMYISRIGIARMVNKHLALGLGLDWLLGRTHERRILDFQSTEFRNSDEAVRNHYSFFRPTFGILAGYKNVNLGMSFSLPRTASVDRRSAFLSGYQKKETIQVKYPSTIRFGTAYRLFKSGMISADLELETWKDSKVAFGSTVQANTQRRFSIGFELLPSAGENPPHWRKIPLRVGYSATRYPYRINGYDVSEKFVTFGAGRYFGGNNGLVDLAVEIGGRKTKAPGYPEERVIRVVASLSEFEKWIPRPKRK